MNRRYAKTWMGLIALYAVLSTQGFALDPQKGITQFTHRSWLVEHGIGDVYSIAQTTDGYLWLATSNGTFRFDGVRFSRLETDPPEAAGVGATPYHVLGSRDGSLWISRGEKVARILRGKQTIYSLGSGLPGGQVESVREGNDGSIWVSATSGISKFSFERWQKFGPESGLPSGPPRTTLLDQKQNLWTVVYDPTQARHVVALLRAGETRFQVVGGAESEVRTLAESPDGKIWAAQWPHSAVQPFVMDQTGFHFEPPQIRATSRNILFDRDGSLWIGTLRDGLRRVRNTRSLVPAEIAKFSETMDAFTQKDGFSSDHVLCLFEGREGEVWVGTSGGLDFFAESKLTSISTREGLPYDQNLLLQPDEKSGIWAGSSLHGFERIDYAGQRIDDLKWFNLEAAHLPAGIYCLYSDPQGGLLAGMTAGVFAIRSGSPAMSPLPGTRDPLPLGDLTHVRAMTRDHSGTLWFCDEIVGVYRLLGGRLEKASLPLDPSNDVVTTCHADGVGRVWMGIVRREGEAISLACHDGGEIRLYSQRDGLFPGKILCIMSDAKGQLWVAGRGGISRFKNGRFDTLTRQNGLPDDHLLSVLQDDAGFFWLAGRSGLLRVGATDLENAFAAKSGTVAGEFFDANDGLRGFIRGSVGLTDRAVAAKSADGRLWFPTSAGLVTIDPRQIFRNSVPPPVHVQQIVAGEKSYSSTGPLSLPIGTRDCEFDYIGICFTHPAEVRYKYKLEGYDEQWVNAGTRRQAFYSNLKPGSYHFHVLACNNDGVWNETGASVAFSIAPAFYERTWFPLVWLLPAALALWGLHRLRLTQLAARMTLRLESQAMERKRIARELHDTLLQGFIGIGLRLDAIATNLPEALAPVRDQLRKILDQSDQYLTEARRSVLELRSPSLEKSRDFAHALSAAAERLTEGRGIKLSYSVNGERRKLPSLVENNLRRIGEEAISNAARHAHATKIEMNLVFDRKEISLRIQDNGCGFDPHGPEAAKAGHFGLVGIQERVKAMNGHLSLTSQPGQGTEIIVTVPAGKSAG